MKAFVRILILLLVLAVGGYFVAEQVITMNLKKSLDEEIAELEDEVEITYDGFRFSLWQRDYIVKGVRIIPSKSQSLILIDRVKATCHDFDINLQTVRELEVLGSGVKFHTLAEDGSDSKPVLNGLGYDDPEFKLHLHYNFDPEVGAVTVNHLNLGNEEIGKLEFQLALTGIKGMETNTLNAENIMPSVMGLLSAITFNSAELFYEDSGFMPRYIKANAEKEGMTEEEWVEQTVKRIRSLEALKISDKILLPLEKFLRKPEKITIEAKPNLPVNSMTLIPQMMIGVSPMDIFGVRVKS